MSLSSGELTINGNVNTSKLFLKVVLLTASSAELNIADGVTATKDELNILNGVTATKDELNIEMV